MTHEPRHVSPKSDPADLSQHLARYGYAIVDDVASPELLDQLASEAEPYMGLADAGRERVEVVQEL